MDTSPNINFIEVKPGMINMKKRSKSDFFGGHKDDLVTYFNLVLNTEGNVYSRDGYDLIDLLEEQGGLT